MTAPLEDCAFFFQLVGAFGIIADTCTSFLFFLRVQAVCLKSSCTTGFFTTLFLVKLALSVVANVYLRSGQRYQNLASAPRLNYLVCLDHVPGTHYCDDSTTKYVTMASVATFVYDTLIFLAISYHIMADAAIEQSWKPRLLSIVKGKGLFGLSRSLMQQGQIYYLYVLPPLKRYVI